MNFTYLTTVQRDVLKEIGNIGAGNAATSMSKLLDKKIDMQVPNVNVVDFDEMMDMIGGHEQLITALFFRIEGEAPGTVYFILSVEEAQHLVGAITKQSGYRLLGENFDEMAVSALQETGNILTSAYLSALSDFTNLNMQPSIPYLSIDMAGAILTAGIVELSQVTDYAIIINTRINHHDSKKDIQGNFFLIPDPATLEKLYVSLGINDHE
ncbi:chemotaxis protein CheC [Virgibacillus oceani]